MFFLWIRPLVVKIRVGKTIHVVFYMPSSQLWNGGRGGYRVYLVLFFPVTEASFNSTLLWQYTHMAQSLRLTKYSTVWRLYTIISDQNFSSLCFAKKIFFLSEMFLCLPLFFLFPSLSVWVSPLYSLYIGSWKSSFSPRAGGKTLFCPVRCWLSSLIKLHCCLDKLFKIHSSF